MKPFFDTPSLTTPNRTSSWLMTLLVCLLPVLIFPLICFLPYVVILQSAWIKGKEKRIWRVATILSSCTAMIVFFIPFQFKGINIPNHTDQFHYVIIMINKSLMMGFIFFPLSLATICHSIMTRNSHKAQESSQA